MKLARTVLMLVVASGLLASLGLATGAAAPAGAQGISPVGFCENGTVHPGTYRAMEIRGNCVLTSSGTVTVLGNLVINRGITFDAITDGDITVLGSVMALPGSILGLGCDTTEFPPTMCTSNSNDEVVGNIVANKAVALIVHHTNVVGNVTMTGGGGGSSDKACSSTSVGGGPPFSTLETGTVGGNVTFTGLSTCWMGMFRVTVGGNVNISNNMINLKIDDAPEIASNTIAGSLSCFANVPAATFGDSGGSPNVAAGGKFGQCAKL